jgi:holo-[acyl-carrier protein] synthase
VSSVAGIGVDLVETARMQTALARWGDAFMARVFADEERAYCETKTEPWRCYAGRFAVKEAVSKAMGTGIGQYVGWRDIITVRDADTGAPAVRFSAAAQAWLDGRGVEAVRISLSHTRKYTVAQAVVVQREDVS